jgi:ATP synthase protein I
MVEKDKATIASDETIFSQQVGAQASRKLKAQRRGPPSVWVGLSMSGLVGWTVSVPTVIGAALGIWIDASYPSSYSWALMLLLVGLAIGCLNAWHWVHSEYQEMQEDTNE